MNFLSTSSDFAHYFSICQPKVVAIDPELLDVVRKALSSMPALTNLPTIFTIMGQSSALKNVSEPQNLLKLS